MPFVKPEALELLLSGSDDLEMREKLLGDFHLSWGSAGKIKSLLNTCGDCATECTHRKILEEFKHKLLGTAAKIDKTVSLEPEPSHGRPASKRPATAMSNLTNCEHFGSEKDETEGFEAKTAEKVGGGVTSKVFTCEDKWLILSVTLLYSVVSTENTINTNALLKMRVRDGCYSKIRSLVLEILHFDVSERSIRRIHAEFNSEVGRVEEDEFVSREVTLAPELKGHSGRPSRLDNALRLRITQVNAETTLEWRDAKLLDLFKHLPSKKKWQLAHPLMIAS